ncbi:GTP-binding protein [Buchananella hordeovulneris]|uniref:CobW C-terminal domain-containing protein n=1 Tax=Buchananella hordeovulneris TaxID=52770 RepID=A0A1Q5PWC9_9ACTO|nr:GTP-binding protein [Buchananella hordeovulneris]OKL51749.1 hypothetical protein BSZ40_06260 [Buchananella hordeovulneris]
MLLATLSAVAPLVRDLTALTAAWHTPVLVCDLDAAGLTLRLNDAAGEQWQQRVELEHSCITCSLREGIVPTLADLVARGTDTLLLALPCGVEPLYVLPQLAELCEAGELEGIELTAHLHAVHLDTLAADLFTHIPLHTADAALFPEDERCTGEVHMVSLGYADLIVAVGHDPLGAEALEHLRPHDTLLLPDPDNLAPELLFGSRHDVERALARVHPASTAAWGGPTEHGVWTLDLHSARPFHPTRFGQLAAELAGTGTCARGCFWLPSRPRTLCTWEVNGGTASVGTAGQWDGTPQCHLIVTGIGGQEQKERIVAAFAEILLNEEEMADALAWVGADDGLADWFADS